MRGGDGEAYLYYRVEEAPGCCTMRGSEGLARMSQADARKRVVV